jgi:hypothetical protein
MKKLTTETIGQVPGRVVGNLRPISAIDHIKGTNTVLRQGGPLMLFKLPK